jgi:DNA-3-methyladenine glycosylase
VAQALGVTGDHNGASLSVGPVRIEGVPVGGEITAGPRVGITRATDRPWRFLLELA